MCRTSILASVVLLVCVGSLRLVAATGSQDYVCVRNGDGNTICDESGDPLNVELCACANNWRCQYKWEWYDPAVQNCSWTHELVAWFIELMKQRRPALADTSSSPQPPTTTVGFRPEDWMCRGLPDGNYDCDPTNLEPSICACHNERRCEYSDRAKEWYDPAIGQCNWSRELAQWLIDMVKERRPGQDSTTETLRDPTITNLQTDQSPKIETTTLPPPETTMYIIICIFPTLFHTYPTTGTLPSAETTPIETTTAIAQVDSKVPPCNIKNCPNDKSTKLEKLLRDGMLDEKDFAFELTRGERKQKVSNCLVKRFISAKDSLSDGNNDLHLNKNNVQMNELPIDSLVLKDNKAINNYIKGSSDFEKTLPIDCPGIIVYRHKRSGLTYQQTSFGHWAVY